MLEFLLDLVLMFLELLGIRKRRKKKTEPVASELNDSSPEPIDSGRAVRGDTSVCAGCRRELENGTVYEYGKAWCVDCYKSHVLKIQT